MAKFQLLYFKGCPNHFPAVELLHKTGIVFTSVCQDDLAEGHELKGYSSPTLLRGNEIIFGAKVCGGGCSVDLPSPEELRRLIIAQTN